MRSFGDTPHCLWCRASCYFNPCTSIRVQSWGRGAVADIQSYLFLFSKLLVLELSLTSGKNEVFLPWVPPVFSLPSTPNLLLCLPHRPRTSTGRGWTSGDAGTDSFCSERIFLRASQLLKITIPSRVCRRPGDSGTQ